jgi:hypothetical protein
MGVTMSEPNKSIKLPGRADMERGLHDFIYSPHLVMHFYPLILEHAGEMQDAAGIVSILQNAITHYLQYVASRLEMFAALMAHFEGFVEVLINDEEVRTEAHRLIEQLHQAIIALPRYKQ